MAELFASGRLIDLILLLVAIEIFALAIYWARAKKGIALIDLLPNVLAGAFLLGALRVTLSDGGWMPACACLAAAGVAHIVDISRRWKS